MAHFNQKPEEALRIVSERLVDRYGQRDPERSRVVRGLVTTEASRFDRAKVQAFVPILVERAVRGRLEHLPSRS